MSTHERRFFLKSSALAAVSFGVAPPALLRAAYAGEHAEGRVVVVLFQRGACDALNTVIPFEDEHYRQYRPSIAIEPPGAGSGRALDLDGSFAFHPALEALLPLYRAGSLARGPRSRVASRHALALRRAGLHGDGDSRGQDNPRRLDEPVSLHRAARNRFPSARGGHDATASGGALRPGASPRDEEHRRLRPPQAPRLGHRVQLRGAVLRNVGLGAERSRLDHLRGDRPAAKAAAHAAPLGGALPGPRPKPSPGRRSLDQGRRRPRNRLRSLWQLGPPRRRGETRKELSRTSSAPSAARSPPSPRIWATAWRTS